MNTIIETVKKWTARLLLSIPLLASLYIVPKIFQSSQGGLAKFYQVLWFSLAICISEAAFEVPELFVPSISVEQEAGQRSPAPAPLVREAGLYFLYQVIYLLAFIMVKYGYHSLVYTFVSAYCPNRKYLANVPILFFILTNTIRHFSSSSSDLCHLINRGHELFTGLVMFCVCVKAENYFGCLAAFVILFGFSSLRKPASLNRLNNNLDQIFWFFAGVYCAIVIFAMAVRDMIERPMILQNLNLFSSDDDNDDDDDGQTMTTNEVVSPGQVARIIQAHYVQMAAKKVLLN